MIGSGKALNQEKALSLTPAAWFIGPGVEETDDDMVALRQEVTALRESTDALRQRVVVGGSARAGGQ